MVGLHFQRVLKSTAAISQRILCTLLLPAQARLSPISPAGIIQARVSEAEDTQASITAAREVYRPVPSRGSLLFQVIADLAGLDPMYQYSLAYFGQLFAHCLAASTPSKHLEARLQAIIAFSTAFMYKTVCRGLFEQHRPIFSFLIASAIQRQEGAVAPEEWDLLLRGSAGKVPEPLPANPAPQWLSSETWAQVLALDAGVPGLKGLAAQLVRRPADWQRLAQCGAEDIFDAAGEAKVAAGLAAATAATSCASSSSSYGGYSAVYGGSSCSSGSLSPFQRLLLVRVFKRDALLPSLSQYVAATLGRAFTQSPALSLQETFKDSSAATPVLFITSQGADPIAALKQLAENMPPSSTPPLAAALPRLGLSSTTGSRPGTAGPAASSTPPPAPVAEESSQLAMPNGRRLQVISLGQGQGPIAEAVLSQAQQHGFWVCLQNCHLAKSWLPRLERLLEQLAAAGQGQANGPAKVHPDFRLWLTSMPVPYFPVAVLQAAVKVTVEPPRGVRATLLRAYKALPAGHMDACPARPKEWRRLVFACSLFHAGGPALLCM